MKRDIFKGGVKVGEEYINPPTPLPIHKSYTGREFWEALKDTEQELMLNKAKINDTAAAVWEGIKLSGIDFNTAKGLAIGAKMIVAGILEDQVRLDELVG